MLRWRSGTCAPPTPPWRGSSTRSDRSVRTQGGAHPLRGVLTEAIVYQQLTGKAAATIFGRVCALFPRARLGPTPEHVLDASDEQLRGAGLSRARLAALRDLRREGGRPATIPSLAAARAMSDDEFLIERLTAVRGIGRWTVEMLLIFRLGRPDVLPVDDYGSARASRSRCANVSCRRAPTSSGAGRAGRPFRTVASWYLWRAADLSKRGA